MPKLLKNFLGGDRWSALWQALRRASIEDCQPSMGFGVLLLALVVALTPVGLTFVDSLRPKGQASTELPTMAFGICAILTLLIRPRIGLPFVRTPNWKQSLSLTHTAVALGCVPAVIILLLSSTILADRHDTLAVAVGGGGGGHPGSPMSLFTKFGLIIAIAAWVAVTEELIFRGMLVSVIRRFRYLPTQRSRDIAAAIVSALIFGLAHWSTWGPLPALGLVGLGIGFVMGYIANGEQLMPLIIYHFAFDLLSLTVSIGW